MIKAIVVLAAIAVAALVAFGLMSSSRKPSLDERLASAARSA